MAHRHCLAVIILIPDGDFLHCARTVRTCPTAPLCMHFKHTGTKTAMKTVIEMAFSPVSDKGDKWGWTKKDVEPPMG